MCEWTVVSTLAGGVSGTNYVDASGSNAGFNRPIGVAVDASGNVLVAETANQRIRKVTAGGGTRIGPVTLRACCVDWTWQHRREWVGQSCVDVDVDLLLCALGQCVCSRVSFLILSFLFFLDAHLCEMLECVSDSDCDS